MSDSFSFDRNILAGTGDVSLRLDAGGTELALALATNSALPKPVEPVIFAGASVGVETGKELNVIDVRDDVKFPPDGFPNHDSIAEADVVRSETLVHVAD